SPCPPRTSRIAVTAPVTNASHDLPDSSDAPNAAEIECETEEQSNQEKRQRLEGDDGFEHRAVRLVGIVVHFDIGADGKSRDLGSGSCFVRGDRCSQPYPAAEILATIYSVSILNERLIGAHPRATGGTGKLPFRFHLASDDAP